MRILRRGVPAVAGLALALGSLTACLGDSSGKSGNASGQQPVQPPKATGSADQDGQRQPQGDDQSGGSLQGKKIVIDPGHNLNNDARAISRQVRIGNGSKECDTTGTATNAGYSEHAFTWDVSKRLEKLLKARGATVIMTRKNDTGIGPCIDERAAIGNRARADAALSIHADGAAASAHGFHIIEPVAVKGFNEKMVPASQKLGRAIRDGYHEGTRVPYSNYRGTKALDPRDDLGGLNLSKIPKVFIECGNMRNPRDAANLSDAGFRQKIAESLLDGFQRYFS